jgi:hypothetical protein
MNDIIKFIINQFVIPLDMSMNNERRRKRRPIIFQAELFKMRKFF